MHQHIFEREEMDQVESVNINQTRNTEECHIPQMLEFFMKWSLIFLNQGSFYNEASLVT